MGEISGYDRSSISGRIKAYPDAGEDRAAQFAPFAALTGFGAVLKETERITEKRIELDEYEKEKLNENLRLLLEKQESRPEITITFCTR